MELLKGGSLHNFLTNMKERGIKIKDYEASAIIKSLLEAVSYLHKLDFAHRDIKPCKFLLDLCISQYHVCKA